MQIMSTGLWTTFPALLFFFGGGVEEGEDIVLGHTLQYSGLTPGVLGIKPRLHAPYLFLQYYHSGPPILLFFNDSSAQS